MVKADLSRDYYGDLELSPNADANEIKRQFKKLALQYHPDRNPGRENEVTARFQKIQSAHEVLTDPHERAKYDSNRVRTNNIYKTGGNPRGNPWSNVSAQYPTPPKAPTARTRPPGPPPPSAGAQRYKHFEAPRQSANQSAQEGAEARRSTYEAWERMRDRPPSGQAAFPKPASRKMPRDGHEENNTVKQNANSRSHTQTSPHRKGFTPNTPGGDEPAAPRTAYATHREKPAQAPPTTNDTQPPVYDRATGDASRRYSKAKSNLQFEPRMSTPYATHGGEKFNPFESININRSKSTRMPSNRYSSDGMPRVGSDPNLNSAHRPRPQDTSFAKPSSTFATPDSNDSSSESGPQIRKKATPRSTAAGTRTFAKARSFTNSRTKPAQFTASSTDGQPNGPSQSDSTNNATHEIPSGSYQTNAQKIAEPSIFSFDVDEDAFNRTAQTGLGSTDPNTVNKTFSPSDWDAIFEASHFAPDTHAASGPHPQSGSRTRGRSPTKSRPMQAHVEPVSSAESSPGGTKFTKDEWAGTFKPQTFMPPSAPSGPTAPNSSRASRKSRVPSIKPTMGTAAVVDDGDTSDDKPLFKGRNPVVGEMPAVPSPDPMDVDTPVPSTTPAPSATEEPEASIKITPNTAAAPGRPQDSADTEYLKVNFEDLKIEDVISSLALPRPPTPPKIPAALLPPTADTRDAYLEKFQVYMRDWDLFYTQMMLHFVERKNRNDALGPTRWLNGDGASFYRKGLQEDSSVLKWWTYAVEKHEKNMKDCQVLRAAASSEAP